MEAENKILPAQRIPQASENHARTSGDAGDASSTPAASNDSFVIHYATDANRRPPINIAQR